MKEFFGNQIKNRFLWVPIIMAFGAATYFSLSFEPNIHHPIIATICILCILLFAKVSFCIKSIFLFLFGFMYAVAFTQIISTPHINNPMRDITAGAYVTGIDFSPDKTRINAKMKLDGSDINVKLSVMEMTTPISVGDTIQFSGTLFPPSSMDAPDTFDYARWSYFNNLSATGYISEYSIIKSESSTGLENIRNKIHNITNSFLVDSLVLGYKNALNPDDKQIWTNTGIAHVWSISGFHMTLVGGWLFAIFYCLFRFIPFITRRIPARIPATICAWCGLYSYLFISGIGVATLRAFLMTTLLFLAIILGRNAISLRNVCIAFLIIFLINPFYVMTAGFQLSFSAIFGLIWFWNRNTRSVFEEPEKQNKILRALYVAVMTAVIATLFTMPFIIAHFQSVPLYSLLGNLVLLPIFSFVIMPMVVIGTVGACFGFGGILTATHSVYNFAFNIATKISELPMSALTMPHMSGLALGIIILGMFMIIFIVPNTLSKHWILRKINYVIGYSFILAGTVVVLTAQKPVFYITGDHELIGMVYDGNLEFNKARASNHYFAFNTFRQLNGNPPSDTNKRRKCDDGVCIYDSGEFKIAYIQKFVPLQKHFSKLCNDDSITYIASYFDISSEKCENKILKNGFVIYKNGHIKYTPFNRWWHTAH